MDCGGNEKRMKVITIALTLFFLNLAMVMVSTLDIYNFNIAAEDQWRAEVESAQEGAFDPNIAVDVSVSFGFGDFVTGFQKFRDVLWRVVNVGETIKLFFGIGNCNLAENINLCKIADLFGFAAGIIYILGIAQFIANRGTKGMQ